MTPFPVLISSNLTVNESKHTHVHSFTIPFTELAEKDRPTCAGLVNILFLRLKNSNSIFIKRKVVYIIKYLLRPSTDNRMFADAVRSRIDELRPFTTITGAPDPNYGDEPYSTTRQDASEVIERLYSLMGTKSANPYAAYAQQQQSSLSSQNYSGGPIGSGQMTSSSAFSAPKSNFVTNTGGNGNSGISNSYASAANMSLKDSLSSKLSNLFGGNATATTTTTYSSSNSNYNSYESNYNRNQNQPMLVDDYSQQPAQESSLFDGLSQADVNTNTNTLDIFGAESNAVSSSNNNDDGGDLFSGLDTTDSNESSFDFIGALNGTSQPQRQRPQQQRQPQSQPQKSNADLFDTSVSTTSNTTTAATFDLSGGSSNATSAFDFLGGGATAAPAAPAAPAQQSASSSFDFLSGGSAPVTQSEPVGYSNKNLLNAGDLLSGLTPIDVPTSKAPQVAPAAPAAPAQQASSFDFLGGAPAPAPAPAQQTSSFDFLGGGAPAPAPAAPAQPSSSFDFLGGGTPAPAAPSQSSSSFDFLGGGAPAPAPAAPSQPSSSSFDFLGGGNTTTTTTTNTSSSFDFLGGGVPAPAPAAPSQPSSSFDFLGGGNTTTSTTTTATTSSFSFI